MNAHNEPHEFTLTPENVLDVLMEWLPDQMERMRLYQSASITINGGLSTLQCQYRNTFGGEKFRIVDICAMGDSGSAYFGPIGADEAIILAFATRIERLFNGCRRRNQIRKSDDPVELIMKFGRAPAAQAA